MRSFAFVLLRRFLFRPLAQPQPPQVEAQPQTLYDHLSSDTLSAIQQLLLHSFSHEPTSAVRQASVETISALANCSRKKGRPWHALQELIFPMTRNQNVALRASAFKVLAGTDMRGMGAQKEDVLRILQEGLEDREGIDVCSLIPSLCFSPVVIMAYSYHSSLPGPFLRFTCFRKLSFRSRCRPTLSIIPPRFHDA
jgi:hypothetical protein